MHRPRLRHCEVQMLLLVAALLSATGCAAPSSFVESATNITGSSSRPPAQRPTLHRPVADTLLLEVHEVFHQTRRWVEEKTGSSLDHVPVRLVTNADIQREVKRETARLVRHQFGQSSYASRFLDRIVDDHSGSYVALYVGTSQEILLSRSLLTTYLQHAGVDPTDRKQALQALLIHELVHAADDRLYQIHKKRRLSFKASFVQSAAFEGHAQLLTRQICETRHCLEGLATLDRFMFAVLPSSDPVAQSVQAVSRNVLEYSYVEGERFLSALMSRPNGQRLVDAVLSNPPTDPVQILVPDTYPDLERERRNRRLSQALHRAWAPGHPELAHSWTRHPWRIVETSPLKGIDVRNDPERRAAAIQGFTQLIQSMVGAQLYNLNQVDFVPVEVTVLEADSVESAQMFVDSLIRQSSGANSQAQWLATRCAPAHAGTCVLYEYQSSGHTATERGPQISAIARHDRRVIQIVAPARELPQNAANYALGVLQHLADTAETSF